MNKILLTIIFILTGCANTSPYDYGTADMILDVDRIVNHTNSWNEKDQLSFESAVRNCWDRYSYNPYLRQFIKKKDFHYNVICGERPFKNVHPKLRKFVRKFDNLYFKYRKLHIPEDIDIKLDFIIESESASGVYDRIRDETIISRNHYYSLSDDQIEEVVFHELGHHVLRLHHDWDNKKLKDGCVATIMNKRGASKKCYIRHKKYYMKELFNSKLPTFY